MFEGTHDGDTLLVRDPAASEAPPTRGTVIVLTADGEDRDGLAARIQAAGYDTMVVAPEASLASRLRESPPALVVVRLTSGPESPLRFASELLRALGSAAPPVLAAVASDDEETFEGAFAAGFRDALALPVPAALLRAKVAHHARRREAPRRQLGTYEVVRLLGRGGMGAVYLARHQGREVALKILDLPPGGAEPEAVARFRREADILRSLRSPHIPRFLDAGRDETCFYVVMEHVPGKSLSQVTLEGPLDEASVARILDEVAEALGTIHACGLVHRDVKPANVIVTPGGTAKLVDFGLAKPVEDRALTGEGDLLGTVHYMAPELLLGAAADACTDAFALGMTGLEALLGRCALSGKAYEIASTLASGRVPRAAELAASASRPLVAALDALLAPKREERASVGAARRILRPIRGSTEGPSDPPPTTSTKIYFPRPEIPSPRVVGEAREGEDRSPSLPRSILVVDDDPMLRRDLCELLAENGYAAIGAWSGSDAIEVIRTAAIKPSLILLDLSMGGMDGWRFRAWQRLQPHLRAVPVVVVSGLAEAESAARGLDAQAVVRKPFEAEAILEVVKKILK